MKLSYLVSAFRVFAYNMKQLTKQEKEDITEIQFKKYKDLVEYAWNEIPAYRKHWSDNGFDPSHFKSLDDLRKIPKINKDFVRENLEEMVPKSYDRARLSLVRTGGTTGMPMNFYIDQYVARPKELAYQLWGGWHYWRHRQGLDKVVTMRGARIKESLLRKGIYWQRNLRENGILMSSFHILEETYPLYLSKLRSYGPRFIKAYPSSIAAFCHLMKKHGDKGIKGLKGVICSSETIYDWHRTLVRETLGVEIMSFYGHSEKAVCAYQNQDGNMEFHPLYGYTEFLDENGRPVTANEGCAYVVATSFDNTYFPFIRYETDDRIDGLRDEVPKIAERIVGRKQEFVYDRYANRLPFTCNDEVISDVQGISAYQYVQHEMGKIELHLQVDGAFDHGSIVEIISRSEEIFMNCTISIKIVNEIEKTPSGKFRYLIQNIVW